MLFDDFISTFLLFSHLKNKHHGKNTKQFSLSLFTYIFITTNDLVFLYNFELFKSRKFFCDWHQTWTFYSFFYAFLCKLNSLNHSHVFTFFLSLLLIPLFLIKIRRNCSLNIKTRKHLNHRSSWKILKPRNFISQREIASLFLFSSLLISASENIMCMKHCFCYWINIFTLILRFWVSQI